MKRMALRLAMAACVAACSTAGAEVDVSVTLTGDINEIMAILAQLRDMGIGTSLAGEGEALKVKVHSVTVTQEGEEEEAAPEAEAPEPEPEKLDLSGANVTPSKGRPGDEIVVSVEVDDPDYVVDTVAATLKTPNAVTHDLFDNGGYGDTVAADGVWMRSMKIPPATPAGEYAIEIQAYDANGNQVMVEEDDEKSPLEASTRLTVIE